MFARSVYVRARLKVILPFGTRQTTAHLPVLGVAVFGNKVVAVGEHFLYLNKRVTLYVLNINFGVKSFIELVKHCTK